MAPSSSGMVLPLLLTGATTLDTDGNGVLDTYRLVFSDPVEDSTFPGFRADAPGDETNAWMVAGRVGVHLLHGVAAPAGDMPGDNILHMGFSPRLPGADTAETPDVTTTASPGLQRADGMALSQVVAATVVETDGAAPALRGALVRGASELEVVFSEPPASAAATMVATYAAPGITLTSPVASGSSIRLTIGARTSGQILTVTSGAIQDAAGNALVAPRNTATLAFPAGNDGTLRARTDYASGTTAVSVAVADFNGNRIPDVVVANYNSNNLVVFLGNGTNGRGTGALTFGSTLLAGTDPSRVVVADFNANGILDIATANFTNDNVSVYLGNGSNGRGSGTFATQVTYSAGIGASSPTLGDFTGDGITDMVVANFGESFLTFLRGAGTNGRGNGTFTAGTNVGNGNTPYSSFAGDFNRDGILDLAVAFEGNDAVRVQLGAGTNGRGNGTFAAATSYPVGNKPRSVEGGDVNGDGIDDLVAVNFGDGTLSVLLGNGTNGVGNGTFQPAVSLAAQANPQRSQFVDFNHDQVLDLVNTNFGPDTLSVRLGNGSRGRGDGTFAAPVTYPAGSNPRGIIAADMDADGVMDLVVANELSNNISVFRGYGGSRRATLGFGAALTAPALDAPTWMVVADADRDGWEDVLVGDAAGQMRMIRSGESTPAGEGALYRAMEISGAATGVAAWTGDLNGDRLPDVVVAGGTANRLQVMLGQGTNTVLTGWAAPVSIPLPGEATDVVAADINSNKVLDLVVTSRSSNAVYILLGAGPAGRGDGTFGAPATLGTCTGPLHTRVADLSGDTIHELLVVCSAGVRLHRGQGTNGVAAGTFGAGTATALTDAADAVVMDANGDAIMDVVAASASVQRVWVMLGGGTGGAPTGALGAPTALGAGTAGGFTRTHVADLDADKLLDLALLDAAGTLTVFRAAGTNGVPTGSFASASTTALGTGTAHVQLTDVNHDGVVDLLAAGPGSAILRHGNWTAIP